VIENISGLSDGINRWRTRVKIILINQVRLCLTITWSEWKKRSKSKELYLLAGDTAQIMANFAFPPRDSCNRNVKRESR
jgi:hypothetical protein